MQIQNHIDSLALLAAKGASVKEIIKALNECENSFTDGEYQENIKKACLKAAKVLLNMRNTGASNGEILKEASGFIEAVSAAIDKKQGNITGLSPLMHKAVYDSENNIPENKMESSVSPQNDDILAEFLNHSKFVLEEMEKLIMESEAGNGSSAEALKRLIHTMKGEAGVLGLSDVSAICHAAEDYIINSASSGKKMEIDPLLEVKDSLALIFDFYSGKSKTKPVQNQVIKLLGKNNAQEQKKEATVMQSILGDEFDAIRREYLTGTVFTLEEIEKLTMDLEKNRNSETIEKLKRIIHTMKGESAAVDINELSEACHEVEDYLALIGEKAAVDALLKFKDFAAALTAYFEGKTEVKPKFEDIKKYFEVKKKPENGAKPAQQRAGKLAGRVVEFTEDPEIIREFINEAREHLENSEQSMMKIENNPKDKDSLNAMFRSFHTIKGNASFMGLVHIKELAHESENLLDKARKDEISLGGEAIEIIFRAIDKLKVMLNETERAIAYGEKIQIKDDVDSLIGAISRVISSGGRAADNMLPAETQAAGIPSAVNTASAEIKMTETLKVDAAKLDRLIDTIGELVIVEAMVRQDMNSGGIINTDDSTQQKHLSQLNKITRDLQDLGFGLRMISLKSTFQKMARLVRDLAKKSGKLIDFVTAGEDTEMDKAVVEKIGDPLVHMLRNAVDHGMDFPAERMERGKAAVGKIELKAYHKSGNIHIEINDDGNGLDRERILKKAVERGLVKEGEEISDSQIYALIFAPGFSTAAKVTDVSGRGVGMDVVKKTVESLRGRIEIKTQKHKGTTFTIILPLTLAIIEGMVIKAGNERYIIPTLSIIRSLKPEPGSIVNVLGQGEVLHERGEIIPVFRLHKLFDIKNAIENPYEAIIIIVEDKGEKAAIMVDALVQQQQVVIKTLGELDVKGSGISGGAIMADGKISVILDAGQLLQLARGISGKTESNEEISIKSGA